MTRKYSPSQYSTPIPSQSPVVIDSSDDTKQVFIDSSAVTPGVPATIVIPGSGPFVPGISSGAAFPAQPAFGNNYPFYRTDLNLWAFYDGTRWLSEQIIIPLRAYASLPSSLVATNLSVLSCLPGLIPTYDFYARTLQYATFVSTTNDGTRNWAPQARTQTAANVTATLGACPTTAADAPNTVVPQSVALNTAIGITKLVIQFGATKVSTPGALEIYGAQIIGNLILT